jgi:uncharacterized protein (DUF433 family)
VEEIEDFRAATWLANAERRGGAYTCSAMKFTRITVRPDVCTGKPCIRDLRFPVSRLLGLLAARQTPDEILRAYPYLEAARLTITIERSGAVLRTLAKRAVESGTTIVSWNGRGRRASGAAVPAGTYVVRAVATNQIGTAELTAPLRKARK